jgi:hypothetical protein
MEQTSVTELKLEVLTSLKTKEAAQNSAYCPVRLELLERDHFYLHRIILV